MDKKSNISKNIGKNIEYKSKKKFPKDSKKNRNDISTPLSIPASEEIVIIKQNQLTCEQPEKEPQDSMRKHISYLSDDKLKKEKEKHSLISKEIEFNKEENTKNISSSKNFSTSSVNNEDLKNNELIFIGPSNEKNDQNIVNQKQTKNNDLVINTNKINNKGEKIIEYKNRFIAKLASNHNKYKISNRKSEGNFGSIIYQRKKKLFTSPIKNYRSINTNESAIASSSSRTIMKEEAKKENKFLKRVEEDLKKIKLKKLENSAKKNKKHLSKKIVTQHTNNLVIGNNNRNSINPNKDQHKLYNHHNRLSSSNNNFNSTKLKTNKKIQKTLTNTSSKRISDINNSRSLRNENIIHSKLVLKNNYSLKNDGNSENIEISLTSLKKNIKNKDEDVVIYKPKEKNHIRERSFSLLTEENRKKLFNELDKDKNKEEKLKMKKSLINSVNDQDVSPYALSLYVKDNHSCNNFSVNNVKNDFDVNKNENKFFHFSKNNNKFRELFEKNKIKQELDTIESPEKNLEKNENKNKKFKFVERNFSKNKDNYRKTSTSSEKYYDLFKKAFNNSDENNNNLEKKFSFKPRSKQKFSIKTQWYDFEENNKYFYNNLSSNNFNTINIVNIKQTPERNSENNIIHNRMNLYEKEVNPFLNDKNNDALNNKNFILDLNNVIPLDEKALLDTFAKNNDYNTRKTEGEKNRNDYIKEANSLFDLKVNDTRLSCLKNENLKTNDKLDDKNEIKKEAIRPNSPKIKNNMSSLKNSKYSKNIYNNKNDKKTNYIVVDFRYDSNPFKCKTTPKNNRHICHSKNK